MAITLRNVKGTELSHAEMDTNFESFYYSSSLSGNTLTLHTTGSTAHSHDIPDTNIANTNLILNQNRTVNLNGNDLTFNVNAGEIFNISGSATAQIQITDLPNTETPVVLGYNTASGRLSYYSTGSIVTPTPTLQQVTTQGATTTNNIEVSGSLDVTGSFSATGQSIFTSLSSLSSPLTIEPDAGSTFGSLYMKTYATPGTIVEFNQYAGSIDSSYTLGSLKFSKQTSTWGLIKAQATNTNQKSVISLTANSTSTPHIEIDGENDEITLKNKILAPDLANTSKPYVVGFDSTSGELTYFTTGSFGSGGGGGGSVDTGSFYVASSINTAGNVITFNQGDGTTESVTVNTTNYTAKYDILQRSGSGPGNERPSQFIAGGSYIENGSDRRTITIPEIGSRTLGTDVFITTTLVGGDVDVQMTVQVNGAAASLPQDIDSDGNIDFKCGGSTVSADTYFMYHIIYTD